MSNLNPLKTTATKLNVTYEFLVGLIEAGHINTLKVGKRLFVSDAEIARFKSTVAA
jgi:hypothetical protein